MPTLAEEVRPLETRGAKNTKGRRGELGDILPCLLRHRLDRARRLPLLPLLPPLPRPRVPSLLRLLHHHHLLLRLATAETKANPTVHVLMLTGMPALFRQKMIRRLPHLPLPLLAEVEAVTVVIVVPSSATDAGANAVNPLH